MFEYADLLQQQAVAVLHDDDAVRDFIPEQCFDSRCHRRARFTATGDKDIANRCELISAAGDVEPIAAKSKVSLDRCVRLRRD